MEIEQTILSQRPPSGTLVILGGTEAGTRFSLKSGSTIIGRETGSDISLADSECSRQHCRIILLLQVF